MERIRQALGSLPTTPDSERRAVERRLQDHERRLDAVDARVEARSGGRIQPQTHRRRASDHDR